MKEGNNLDKSKKCGRGNKPKIYILLTRMSNISIKKGDGVKTKTKIGIWPKFPPFKTQNSSSFEFWIDSST